MDTEDRHKQIMEKLHEMHQHNVESHGAIATILISIRENTWHQFKLIHDKLLDLFSWNKGAK